MKPDIEEGVGALNRPPSGSASVDWLHRSDRLGKGKTMGVVITVFAVIGIIAVVFWLMRRA